MAEYLLGVDNGNTVSKAAIFDLEGREVQVATRKIESQYPHPGWTERSMDVLWQSTAEAIREAIEASGIDPKQIVGIGNTGHGNGLYLLDKQGRPARAGIQSMDTRAAGVIDEWDARDLHSQVFPYTIQSFWPAQPNALLAWIKRYEPEVYAVDWRCADVQRLSHLLPDRRGRHRLYRHERHQPDGRAEQALFQGVAGALRPRRIVGCHAQAGREL